MAKGEILEHVGDGQYRVLLKYAIERIQQELAGINSRIAELAVIVPQKKLALIEADNLAASKAAEIDSLIPDYQAGVPGVLRQIQRLQVELARLQVSRAKVSYEAGEAVSEDLSLKKRRAQIERIPEEQEITAWCADFVTDATGEVGLVQVNDEGGDQVIIQPAFSGAGGYTPSRDGQLVPRPAQSGKQVWFNAAVLPGVQKWFPRYRVGTITSLDGETANVSLDPAHSSAQGLNINRDPVLHKVPVQYMDCNIAAFDIGDRVLVRWFQSGPQVIGFESNPKPCTQSGFYFLPTLALGNNEFDQYGEPFFDGAGEAINAPLGTTFGSNPAWSIVPAYRNEPYTISKGIEGGVAGNRNYIGPTPELIVSWPGPPSRFFEMKNEVNLNSGWRTTWTRGSVVYYKLAVLINLQDYSEADGFLRVAGAAIKRVPGGFTLLVMGASPQNQGESYRFFQFNIANDKTVTGNPVPGPILELPQNLAAVTDWYFNQDADKAVLTARSYNTQLDTDPDRSKVYLYQWSLAGGYSSELLYDSTDGPGVTRVDTKYESLTKTSGVGLSRDYYRLDTRPGSGEQLLIPIYADYVGNSIDIAYHQVPATSQNATENYEQKAYNKEYPHPCAGQPREGGGTYPETFYIPNAEVNHEISYSRSISRPQPEKILNSSGAVLAELPFSNSLTESSNTISNQENAESINDCGDFILHENSYTVTHSYSNVYRNPVASYEEFAIDIRERFVVIGYEKVTETRQGVRTGEIIFDDTVEIDTFNRFIRLNATAATERTEKFIDVWINRQKIHSQKVQDETIPLGSTYNLVGDRVLVPATSLDSQVSTGTVEQTTGPTTVEFVKNPATVMVAGYRLADCAAVRAGPRLGVSVLFASNLYPMFSFQRLDELGDVVQEMFERSPEDLYSMHRLTVF